MRYWITTDTHLGHRKLEELSGRPLNFENLIIENHRKMILPDDILIHLGDFALCKSDEYLKWNNAFTALPFKKILVLGNHDKKSDSWYYDHGWDFVCKSFSIKFLGNRILFTHIPQEKFHLHNINIHGHFHNNDHRFVEPEIQKYYDPKFHKPLAIEYTNYQPILLETFLNNETDKDKTKI